MPEQSRRSGNAKKTNENAVGFPTAFSFGQPKGLSIECRGALLTR